VERLEFERREECPLRVVHRDIWAAVLSQFTFNVCEKRTSLGWTFQRRREERRSER
jgi:hypothetical protein